VKGLAGGQFYRKERKIAKNELSGTGTTSLQTGGPGKFANLEFERPEVDKEAVLDSGRLQIAEYLRLVFRRQRPGGFKLNDQLIVDQQVRQVVAEGCAVFIQNLNSMLLLHVQSELPQSMRKAVFVDLFEMTVCVIDVNIVGCLPDLITQFGNGFHTAIKFRGGFNDNGHESQNKGVRMRRQLFALYALYAVIFRKLNPAAASS
jgi:hypothetical protein